MGHIEATLSTDDLLRSLGLEDDTDGKTYQIFRDFEQTVKETFNPSEIGGVISAMHIMAQAHIGQRRKDGSLYIFHPVEVARDVIALCAYPDKGAVIAALFHDVVEDQSEAYVRLTGRHLDQQRPPQAQALEAIGDDFGDDVAQLVTALTNPNFGQILASEGIDKDHPEFSRRMKELYAQHVASIIEDPRVCIIKFADFSRNCCAFPKLKNSEMKREIGAKYRPVVDIFRARINDKSKPLNTCQQSDMLLELGEIAELIDKYFANLE